jgi:hypothetical protein
MLCRCSVINKTLNNTKMYYLNLIYIRCLVSLDPQAICLPFAAAVSDGSE